MRGVWDVIDIEWVHWLCLISDQVLKYEIRLSVRSDRLYGLAYISVRSDIVFMPYKGAPGRYHDAWNTFLIFLKISGGSIFQHPLSHCHKFVKGIQSPSKLEHTQRKTSGLLSHCECDGVYFSEGRRGIVVGGTVAFGLDISVRCPSTSKISSHVRDNTCHVSLS